MGLFSSKEVKMPLISDLNNIVLSYVPLSQLNDLQKLFPEDMLYFLRGVPLKDKIKGFMIECGHSHTVILTVDGILYVCGHNGYGQLGLGHKTNLNIFTKVRENVKHISCGHSHTMIITYKNELYGCGSNIYGELGFGLAISSNSFVKIMDDVTTVACGYYHTMVIKDNILLASGKNNHGQLGLGHNLSITSFQNIMNVADNSLISCGGNTTMLLYNKKLYGCGYNETGQLSLGHTNDVNTFQEIKLHSSNTKHIHFEENCEDIECKFFSDQIISLWCRGPYTSIKTSDGTYYICGKKWTKGKEINSTIFVIMPECKNIITCGPSKIVFPGYYHSMYVALSGELYGIGANREGQLGTGDNNEWRGILPNYKRKVNINFSIF
jgi:alpha-tubulin suppressor-like RCC1 family protein